MENIALEKIKNHKTIVSIIGNEYILPRIVNYDLSSNKKDDQSFDLIDLLTYFDMYSYLLENEGFGYRPEWKNVILRIMQNTKKYFEEKNLPLTLENMYLELEERIKNHDNSKLEEPELTKINLFYMEYLNAEIGSPDYYRLYNLVEKKHKANNQHHPEYYENGISDMNLIDLLEMLIDLRSHSLEDNLRFFGILIKTRDKYQMDETTFSLFHNTYLHYLKTFEKEKQKIIQ